VSAVLGEKGKSSDAEFFVQDKVNNERCEGVYSGYMTEQIDEVSAVRKQKGASGPAQDLLVLARQATTDERERTSGT
jgi:hypothetical protein